MKTREPEMKNWTVTLAVKHPLGGGMHVNEYVTEICGWYACEIAEKRAAEKYGWAFVEGVEECCVSPRLAEALDGFLSEEYDVDSDNLRETLKPMKNGVRIPILYTTLDLTDNDGNYLAEDIEIQIYLNYLTGALEVWTDYNEAVAYVDGYYNDDELAEIMENSDFQGLYDDYAWRVRQWWIDHPDRFKETYGEDIPEGTEA